MRERMRAFVSRIWTRVRAALSKLRLFKRLNQLETVNKALAICDGCGSVLFVRAAIIWHSPKKPIHNGNVTSCGNCRTGLVKRFPPTKEIVHA